METWHLGQIDPEDALEFTAQVELRLVAARARFVGGPGRKGFDDRIDQALEGGQTLGDLLVASGDEFLVVLVAGAGLAQAKEVLVAPVAFQALADDCGAGFDPGVAQGGKFPRIPLAA